MYESGYGTDWESLSTDEIIERAFALGVATTLGHPVPDEYERLREEISTAYDRNVVQLAFEEGRNRAREYQHQADEDADRDVWEELVEPEAPSRSEADRSGRDGVPTSVRRLNLLDGPDDDLDRVRLPRFLSQR